MADKNNPFEDLNDSLKLIIVMLSKLLKESETTSERGEKIRLLETMPDQLETKHLRLLFDKTDVTFWNWKNRKILFPETISGRKYYKKSAIIKLLNEGDEK